LVFWPSKNTGRDITENQAKAKYENGLLTIQVTFKDAIEGAIQVHVN
jgi:HSP20 family molecular chaperone IbpA